MQWQVFSRQGSAWQCTLSLVRRVSARRQLAGQGERGEKRCRDMEVLLVLRLCCNCTYGNDCSMSESSAVMMCSPVGCHAGAPLRLLWISCYVEMNYSRWLFLRSALNLCCAGIHWVSYLRSYSWNWKHWLMEFAAHLGRLSPSIHLSIFTNLLPNFFFVFF